MARTFGTFLLIVSAALLLAAPASAEPIQLPDNRTIETIDFERQVHALLDRHGCNAGKCHGNRDGKHDFKLSLLSAAPAQDHVEIVRKSLGRYLDPVDPDRSLLLLKATGEVPHDGGVRVPRPSWEYRLLRQWIAEGACHVPGRGQIKGLHVVPREHIFAPGESLQLKVFAEFADGTKEDVTCFSDFRLAVEEPPVRVSATGKVQALKPGDVGVNVFYRSRMRVLRATVAYPELKGFVYPKVPEANLIDREVFSRLRKLNIVPSDLCSDEHFLRRVTIDLIGTIPTPVEVRAFLASKDPDKRTRKIDELLAHPLHAAVLALRLCEMTEMTGGGLSDAASPQTKAAQMAHAWFRQRLSENMPYDRIALGVLTATSKEGRAVEAWQLENADLQRADTGFEGAYAKRSTLDHYWRNAEPVGQAGFSHRAVFGDPPTRRFTDKVDSIYMDNLAERTAAVFLGVQLDCARCHVHPLDGWTPTDHRAFANLFGQVGLEEPPYIKKKNHNESLQLWNRARFAREVFLEEPANQHADPTTGVALKPRILGGPEVDFQNDARRALARWLARPDNRFFARHFVNATWEHYFGLSLIEATDSYASVFEPANSALLDLLAREFIQHHFDIRRLERTILLSRTYQLSTTTNESNKHDRTNFSHTLPHRPGPRVAADMLHRALETTESFGPGVPEGLHAVEVAHLGEIAQTLYRDAGYRTRVRNMVAQFGRGDLVSRCDNETDLTAYIGYMGSSLINALFAKSKRIQRLAKSTQSIDEIVDECCLATIGRLPDAEERRRIREHIEREPSKRQHQIEDVFWALINCKEFLMQH